MFRYHFTILYIILIIQNFCYFKFFLIPWIFKLGALHCIYVIYKIYNIHIRYILYIYIIYKIYRTYISCMFFFFFQVIQPGIEPGLPRSLYPDDVIRKILGHEGHPIYFVNEVLFISHFLLYIYM